MVVVNFGDDNNPFYSCTLSVQAPVIQRAENFIQRIKCTGWSTFYPLDSDLSAGQSYPLVGQPRSDDNEYGEG